MTGSSSAVGMLRRLSLWRSASTEMSLLRAMFPSSQAQISGFRALGLQPRSQAPDDVERGCYFAVVGLWGAVLVRIAVGCRPFCPASRGGYQLPNVGKACLRRRPELHQRMRLARALGGQSEKAFQQLFQRLLTVECRGVSQRRIGRHASEDGFAVALGHGEPAFN